LIVDFRLPISDCRLSKKWSQALSKRTKTLFALAGLAPASILVTKLDIDAAVKRALAAGYASAWIEPGLLFYIVLFLGLASLVAAVVSLLFDVRRAR
jgi:hypothetical protein